MSSLGNAWSRRDRSSTDVPLERSAYVFFTEFCSDTMIQPGELAKLLNISGRTLSVFHLSERKAAVLAEAMGIDLDLWNHARGADLLAGRVSKRVFLGELRYCPTCLASAHHSTLFQLTQVMKCPIHKEPLRTGCPHCGRSISTDVLGLARNHLYCATCNRHLATEHPRTRLVAWTDHPHARLFAPLRQAITADSQAGERRSHLPWDKLPTEVAPSPALIRRHHLHTVWGNPAMGSDFLSVKTESMPLDVERKPELVPAHFTPTFSRTMRAFEELAVQLERHQKLGDMPKGVLSDARVDEPTSAIAAAFWQTAWTMGVHRFLSGRRPSMAGWSWGPWFLPWLPEHNGALTRVVKGAVYTLFALCLIRTGRLRYGVQVAWHRPPDWHQFLPPWRLLPGPDAGQLELQVRVRADEKVIDRLVSRYREHRLLETPEGVSPLKLVNDPPQWTGFSRG